MYNEWYSLDLGCEVATLEHMMASEGNGWPVNHANSTDLRYGNSKTPAISLFVTGGRPPAHSTLCRDCEWPQWADPARED